MTKDNYNWTTPLAIVMVLVVLAGSYMGAYFAMLEIAVDTASTSRQGYSVIVTEVPAGWCGSHPRRCTCGTKSWTI
jgi:hypothetical protein